MSSGNVEGAGGAICAGWVGLQAATLIHSNTTKLRRVDVVPSKRLLNIAPSSRSPCGRAVGRIFGTILLDLEAHRVIDFLPDRTVGLSPCWCAQQRIAHPASVPTRVQTLVPRSSNCRTEVPTLLSTGRCCICVLVRSDVAGASAADGSRLHVEVFADETTSDHLRRDRHARAHPF